MVTAEIKTIISVIKQKYKYSENKLNTELDNLKEYVKVSDLYVGKKKRIYKLINSNKK